jgi:cell division protein FtsZ
MANILKDITNQLKVDEKSELFEQKIDVNKRTNSLFNNLDDIEDTLGQFNVKVFGVGGAGCNVIEHMIKSRVWPENVNLYALNTDLKALQRIKGLTNICLLGKKTLRGAGSGGDPSIGKISVDENRSDIRGVLEGTDILFIVAGLGKGTGSGASPEIARIAKELGILTVAIVNFPSVNAEGRSVYENALNSFDVLKAEVNSITRISNDKIINSNKDISFVKAFEQANIAVTNTVSDVVDMVGSASNMNLDFADIRNFFKSHATFMAGTFSVENSYTKDALKEAIKRSVRDSFSDVNIKTENVKVILNLKINNDTPATINNDIRNVFKELTNTNALSLVPGVDQINIEGIKASYLMSAGDQANHVEEDLVYEEASMEVSKVNDNNQSVNDMFKIDEDLNLDEYKSKPVSVTNTGGVKRETMHFDTEELIVEGDRFNSRDASKLITKAINSVMKPDVEPIDFTRKYN